MKFNQVVGAPDEEDQTGNDLPDSEVDQIVASYINTITKRDKFAKPVLLCPVGLIGTGKTTVVNALANNLGMTIVSNDEIRALLKANGYNNRRSSEVALLAIMELLDQGFGVAIDADCARGTYQLKDQIDVLDIWIHIVAAEKVVLSRLAPDNTAREYRGEEARSRYNERKKLHQDLKFNFVYTFDTTLVENFAEQVEQATIIIQKIINSENK